MKVSEILTQARGYVEEGWTKHVGMDPHGNVCMYGALALAEANTGISSMEARKRFQILPSDALQDVIREQFGPYGVADFNDHPSTTKQDVLNAFDKAIIGLEEKGL